ncbi:shikimate dehydrogenase family protein [Sphaerochaeta globosa]|uniref:Shikimate dehydrogenase (NADP(+)) n=1 Tax=Sphaerochaeta globosa (strain ATCC BAA-1886 / DSM 22777 / Buddy) TaxID=158189 RepID=F0RXL6_SPHGB|nr:shikimate dehydrogenase [Sphaerochaeta globosa]ADY12066.1 Shikimate dehydrogenase [Sphaerochaeta globosa str. Buddy]
MDRKSSLQALMKGPLAPLYFCIGSPVVGNPTQYMVEAAFDALGYCGRYLTIDVDAEELDPSIWGLLAMNFAGGNVTAPFKQEVLTYLDELTESASLCDAVNCITRKSDGTYIGDNTDGKGFLQSLIAVAPDLKKRKVMVFGSGGAASAIVTELALYGVREVVVVNRTEAHAKTLVNNLEGISRTQLKVDRWAGTYQIVENDLVVVQATSVGLFQPGACIDVAFAPALQNVIACDVVFNPVETAFLKKAKSAGCLTLDGLGMLVNQGAIAIQLWTGKEPDKALMRSSLEEAFAVC